MNGVQAIQAALESTKSNLNMFLSDFSDADMLVRPVPAANHAAWQVGNVIVGDVMITRGQLPEIKLPELPAGFVEMHGPEGTKKDGPDGFLTRDEYVNLFNAVRGAVIDAVGTLSDADLDRPTTGNLAQFAPTLGAMLLLVSNHTLMHGGQVSVIRRVLGKPVLF